MTSHFQAALLVPECLSTAADLQQSTEPAGIAGWVVNVMETIGAPGAGFVVALENLFPPIPSEVILPLAGFTASLGNFTLWEAILWTTAGSGVGSYLLYLLGAWLGRDRSRKLFGRIPFVSLHDADKVEAWFTRHGHKAVFYGRMIPLFRSLISIPAGVTRMPLIPFLGLSLAGSAIWNSTLVLAGYFLGEGWPLIEQYADILQKLVIAGTTVLVIAFLVKKANAFRATSELTTPKVPAEPDSRADH